VSLLIEPEPGLLIELFEQYLELAERVDSPWLGLNFDIGHAFCMEQEPAEWVPRMAGQTRHYHLEDIDATREHAHRIPGRGVIDLGRVLHEIKESRYEGFVTVELYPYLDDPDQAGREALDYINRLLGSE